MRIMAGQHAGGALLRASSSWRCGRGRVDDQRVADAGEVACELRSFDELHHAGFQSTFTPKGQQ